LGQFRQRLEDGGPAEALPEQRPPAQSDDDSRIALGDLVGRGRRQQRRQTASRLVGVSPRVSGKEREDFDAGHEGRSARRQHPTADVTLFLPVRSCSSFEEEENRSSRCGGQHRM
jgi:hypothetical protein